MRSASGVVVTPGTTHKPVPDRPQEYCPGCGKPDPQKRWEPGMGWVYKAHQFHGGTVECWRSNRPVKLR